MTQLSITFYSHSLHYTDCQEGPRNHNVQEQIRTNTSSGNVHAINTVIQNYTTMEMLTWYYTIQPGVW